MAIEELPQNPDVFCENDEPSDYNPCCTWEAWEESMIRFDPIERGLGQLFVYASCHWLRHFGAVSVDSLLPGLGNIERVCQAGSIRLHNWITQNCRPDCAIKPRFDFDSSLYDALSITSLYGSEAMLLGMLERSDFNGDSFLPNSAMGAADQILRWGELPRLTLLWRSRIGHRIRNLCFFRLVMKQWCSSPLETCRQGWDAVFDLVDDAHDTMVRERWDNQLLLAAVRMGCMPIIRLLTGGHDDKAIISEHGLIGEAVLGNHVDVVGYLVGQRGIDAHAAIPPCSSN